VASPTKSLLPNIPLLEKERHVFFLNFSGQYMTKRQVTHRVNEVIKQACPNIKGKVHGSHIRKLVVSSHREDPTHAISKEELASQITHNVKTANKYYYSHGEVNDKLKVGRYLDAMTKEYDALERCNVGSEAKKPAICSEEKWVAVYRQRS
jgi:hypothetical protein